jgi:hypothetical protein
MIKSGIFTIIFIATQAINTPAKAQNKCLINGQISYQDIECPKGTDQSPKPKELPTPHINLSNPTERRARLKKIERDLDEVLKIPRQKTISTPTPTVTSESTDDNQVTKMDFNTCVASVNNTLKTILLERRNGEHLMDTPTMTMTKICASDGRLLITCSKNPPAMVTTKIKGKC